MCQYSLGSDVATDVSYLSRLCHFWFLSVLSSNIKMCKDSTLKSFDLLNFLSTSFNAIKKSKLKLETINEGIRTKTFLTMSFPVQTEFYLFPVFLFHIFKCIMGFLYMLQANCQLDRDNVNLIVVLRQFHILMCQIIGKWKGIP